MPKSRVPSDDVQAEQTRPADEVIESPAGHHQSRSRSDADVTPLDGEEFLAANRGRREKLRAEAADRVPRRLDTTNDVGATGRARRLVRGRTLVGILGLLVIALAISTGVLAYLYVQADGRASDDGPSDADRATLGIGPGLIRLSVGLEHPDDLIADLLGAIG